MWVNNFQRLQKFRQFSNLLSPIWFAKKINVTLLLIFSLLLFSLILLLNLYRHSDKNFTEKFAGKIRRRLPENDKKRKFTMPSRKNDSDFWLKFRNLSGANVPMCTSYRANRRRCSRERAPRSLGKFWSHDSFSSLVAPRSPSHRCL